MVNIPVNIIRALPALGMGGGGGGGGVFTVV